MVNVMTELSKRISALDMAVAPPSEILSDIVALLSSCGRTRLKLSQEETDELLSDFFPSITGIIKRYDSHRTSFEGYVCTLFRLFRSEQHRNRKKREQIDRILRSGVIEYPRNAQDLPVTVKEQTPVFSPALLSRRNDAARKRLLCTVCRSAANLSDRDIHYYTLILQLPEGWLLGVSTWARTVLERKYERLERLREKRDLYYSRYIRCEDRLRDYHDEEERRRMEHRLNVNKSRLNRVRQRIRSLHFCLPHSQLSRLLGIPKGSIDSCMAVVKRGLVKTAQSTIPSLHENTSGEQQPA